MLDQETQVGNGWAQGDEQSGRGVHVPCHSQVLSSFTSKWINLFMNFHHSLLAIVAPLPFAAQLKSKGMCWSPFAVSWTRQSWCFVSG